MSAAVTTPLAELSDEAWRALPAEVRCLRWCRINTRRARHLWLGSVGTACGLVGPKAERFSVDFGPTATACAQCVTYAKGWLDRDEFGPEPPFNGPPNPAPNRKIITAERVKRVAAGVQP